MERLRYSDRTKLADEGSLGPLSYDQVPEKLGAALASIYEHAARRPLVGTQFDTRARAACEQHFGRSFYYVNATTGTVAKFFRDRHARVPDLLDAVEILVEEASRTWIFTHDNGKTSTLSADDEVDARVNAAFIRHRFGSGRIRRIGSPALDEAVVRPALIAIARPGWEQADRSYRDALHHRRGGPEERGAAITDAHAALEAAMKAAGLKGDTLASLAKSFRNSRVVLTQLEGIPEMLDNLLKRSQSVRDSLSDAHGRDPGTEEVAAEVVDLAIHCSIPSPLRGAKGQHVGVFSGPGSVGRPRASLAGRTPKWPRAATLDDRKTIARKADPRERAAVEVSLGAHAPGANGDLEGRRDRLQRDPGTGHERLEQHVAGAEKRAAAGHSTVSWPSPQSARTTSKIATAYGNLAEKANVARAGRPASSPRSWPSAVRRLAVGDRAGDRSGDRHAGGHPRPLPRPSVSRSTRSKSRVEALRLLQPVRRDSIARSASLALSARCVVAAEKTPRRTNSKGDPVDQVATAHALEALDGVDPYR